MKAQEVMERLVGVSLEKGQTLPKELDDRQVLIFREGIWRTPEGDATVYLQDDEGSIFWVRVKRMT